MFSAAACQEFCSQWGSAWMHAGILVLPGTGTPLAPDIPQEQIPPQQYMLRDTVNKPVVCILLEGNLVLTVDASVWNLRTLTRDVLVFLKFCKILVSARFCGVYARQLIMLLHWNYLFKLYILWRVNSQFLWVQLKNVQISAQWTLPVVTCSNCLPVLSWRSPFLTVQNYPTLKYKGQRALITSPLPLILEPPAHIHYLPFYFCPLNK